MLEIPQIAGRLGLTEPQSRRLLKSLDTVLEGFVTHGRDNRILVQTDAIGILDRAAQLWRDDGLTLAQLPDALKAELDKDQPVSDRLQPPTNGHRCPTCAAKDDLVEELREQNRWLRERVEELEVKALPHGRPWWQRLLGLGISQ